MLYATVTLQNKLTTSIGLIYLLRPYIFFLTSGLFFLFLLLLLMLHVIYYPPSPRRLCYMSKQKDVVVDPRMHVEDIPCLFAQ